VPTSAVWITLQLSDREMRDGPCILVASHLREAILLDNVIASGAKQSPTRHAEPALEDAQDLKASLKE